MQAILLQMNEKCVFLEADTIEKGVAAAGGRNLDLIIIDLDVPEIDGIGMLDVLVKSGLDGPIVVYSTVEAYDVMRCAYEMGVSAFITEQTKKEIIISVFQIVLAGGKYFCPEVIAGRPDPKNKNTKRRRLNQVKGQQILSSRQYEVLGLLSQGKPNKAIARELEIATGTVKVHIAAILKTLKAKNRTQAVCIAQDTNLL